MSNARARARTHAHARTHARTHTHTWEQREVWVQKLREAAGAADSQLQRASVMGEGLQGAPTEIDGSGAKNSGINISTLSGLQGGPRESATSMHEAPLVRSSSSPSPPRSPRRLPSADTQEPVRSSTRSRVGETCEGCRARSADVKRYNTHLV